jgi:hypothetical protein
MRVRNNNPLDLEADDGETVAVAVQAKGTVPVVNFILNGQPFQGGSFTASKQQADPAQLFVQVVFSGGSGGVYDVTLIGAGGSSSRYTIGQPHGETVNSINFTIDVM